MDEKHISLIIQTLEKYLSERIEKLWRVFSWTSSILITIAGGIVVLEKKFNVNFNFPELILISFIILLLTAYAISWINENLSMETKIRNQIQTIFEENIKYIKLKEIRPDMALFGYKLVILLLGVASLIATWINY